MRGGIIVSVVIERNPQRFHFNVDLTDSTPKYNCTTKNKTKNKRYVKEDNWDLQDLESTAEGMIPLSAYKLPQGLNSRN